MLIFTCAGVISSITDHAKIQDGDYLTYDSEILGSLHYTPPSAVSTKYYTLRDPNVYTHASPSPPPASIPTAPAPVASPIILSTDSSSHPSQSALSEAVYQEHGRNKNDAGILSGQVVESAPHPSKVCSLCYRDGPR